MSGSGAALSDHFPLVFLAGAFFAGAALTGAFLAAAFGVALLTALGAAALADLAGALAALPDFLAGADGALKIRSQLSENLGEAPERIIGPLMRCDPSSLTKSEIGPSSHRKVASMQSGCQSRVYDSLLFHAVFHAQNRDGAQHHPALETTCDHDQDEKRMYEVGRNVYAETCLWIMQRTKNLTLRGSEVFNISGTAKANLCEKIFAGAGTVKRSIGDQSQKFSTSS
jgi:hypothetical protein